MPTHFLQMLSLGRVDHPAPQNGWHLTWRIHGPPLDATKRRKRIQTIVVVVDGRGLTAHVLEPMQPTPNSKDWLEALEKINPMQEAQGAELSLVD